MGEYLSGLTESTATLAKEAVMVNELNQVSHCKRLMEICMRIVLGIPLEAGHELLHM